MTRLHPSDWFVATHFVRDFDYSIAVQYHRQLRVLHWALGILAVAAPILWACERAAIRNIRPWRAPAGSFAAAIVATFMCFTALLHSQYLRALAGFHDAELQWAYNGLRISSVVLQVGQLTRMDREIKSLQAEARDFGLLSAPASATAATCGTAGCPDIVIVHLESVFDPVLLADYRATGGYLGQMEKKSSAASKSGLLRVHTWGGASWISEFAVLCGVDPTIFGLAGAQPHLNLSRYVKNCLPNYLKRLGYETHAIYTFVLELCRCRGRLQAIRNRRFHRHQAHQRRADRLAPATRQVFHQRSAPHFGAAEPSASIHFRLHQLES